MAFGITKRSVSVNVRDLFTKDWSEGRGGAIGIFGLIVLTTISNKIFSNNFNFHHLAACLILVELA